MQKINRVGEINYNSRNEKMTIVEYQNKENIYVKFEDGTIVKSRYCTFKIGIVKNPNSKIVENIGYMGIGKYSSRVNKQKTIQYKTWTNIIKRCNRIDRSDKNKSYYDCKISLEWHNFQNFAKWFDDNYYTVKDEKMNLDKDLLIKGNRIYSPNKCIFLPEKINTLLINNKSNRGKYPLGVSYSRSKNLYTSRFNRLGKYIDLGNYKTPEKAFEVYKKHKEIHIKEMAESYKSYIPIEAYNALIDWQIEITD